MLWWAGETEPDRAQPADLTTANNTKKEDYGLWVAAKNRSVELTDEGYILVEELLEEAEGE